MLIKMTLESDVIRLMRNWYSDEYISDFTDMCSSYNIHHYAVSIFFKKTNSKT